MKKPERKNLYCEFDLDEIDGLAYAAGIERLNAFISEKRAEGYVTFRWDTSAYNDGNGTLVARGLEPIADYEARLARWEESAAARGSQPPVHGTPLIMANGVMGYSVGRWSDRGELLVSAERYADRPQWATSNWRAIPDFADKVAEMKKEAGSD